MLLIWRSASNRQVNRVDLYNKRGKIAARSKSAVAETSGGLQAPAQGCCRMCSRLHLRLGPSDGQAQGRE